MAYKNILENEMAEFNKLYKLVCKRCPSESIVEKQKMTLSGMLLMRCPHKEDITRTMMNPFENSKTWQRMVEIIAVTEEVKNGVNRFYIKDESLFDFFKETEVRPKELQSLIKSLEAIEDNIDSYDAFEMSLGKRIWGVIGQTFAFTIVYTMLKNKHTLTILTKEMNYTMCIDEFDPKADPKNKWIFNLAINFLFYINAFPDCVVDGVPNGVKRNPTAKSISMSDKIVSHRTVEHGFVRPHFRSGYFRHMNSDWYVNCKGQVRFIASTMVKGRAKTVISQGEEK